MSTMVLDSSTQRIARLTPLGEVLARIDGVSPVAPRRSALDSALGVTLAEDVAAPLLPPAAIALRDGFAVAAAAFADAGPYMPVPFAAMPHRLDVGEPLPSGTDAVAPLDAVAVQGNVATMTAPVAPADGVLPAGGDAAPQRPLRRAGERLRAVDIGILQAAGIAEVAIRAPRIRIASGSATSTPLIQAAVEILSRAVKNAGAVPRDDVMLLEHGLADATTDAVIAVGGTGSGRGDKAVRELARLGRVEVHGIALSPGETAAFGFVSERPVVLVPGRLDAVLAVWLLLGRHLVAKLGGGRIMDAPTMATLKRKVASTIGLTELVPVACADGMAETLGQGYLSFEALARSDGWIAVPPDSEGFEAGTPVAVGSWP